MKKIGPKLPFPGWYTDKLLTNPHFHVNPDMIQIFAYQMANKFDVSNSSDDQFRVLRLHVDEQPDFGWPLTAIDPETGDVTRYLPKVFRDIIKPLDWWNQGNDKTVWFDSLNPVELKSVAGGRLAVPNSWINRKKSIKFDLKNSGRITQHAFTVDFHPFTARFDMNFFIARPGNRYNLPTGAHPYPMMDGTNPFPVLTPDMIYHPEKNPNGDFEGVATAKAMVDETYEYVEKCGVVVLWTKHCHNFTMGSCIDPVVMASVYHQYYMRGTLDCEPLFFTKGKSWRTDEFGAGGPAVKFADDDKANPNKELLQISKGIPEKNIRPFDATLVTGDAGTHCVPETVKQIVNHLEATGNKEAITRIIYFKDGMSPIPGFEDKAREDEEFLSSKGVRLMNIDEFSFEEEAERIK